MSRILTQALTTYAPASYLADTSVGRQFFGSLDSSTVSGLVLARGDRWLSTVPGPVVPPTGYTRPSGAGYTRYEDLYVSGDTVTAAVARTTNNNIVTFPVGHFTFSDFATGYLAGFTVPTGCGGIWGSGPGDITGTTNGTYFSMVPNTSTHAGDVPTQASGSPTPMRIMQCLYPTVPQSYGQFQVQGTEQGHIYHGFTVFGPTVATAVITMTDLLVTGCAGNAGGPPGETFSIEIYGAPDCTILRCETNGYRYNGDQFGSAGITVENAKSGTVTNCYTHDHMTSSGLVIFQSNGVTSNNHRVVANNFLPGGDGANGINHERNTNIVHNSPNISVNRANGNVGLHMTFSNDTYSATYFGTTVNTSNGTLKVVNPTYNNALGDGLFYIQSWTPYGNGDTQASIPLVTQADGVTHLPYEWVHNTHYYIT